MSLRRRLSNEGEDSQKCRTDETQCGHFFGKLFIKNPKIVIIFPSHMLDIRNYIGNGILTNIFISLILLWFTYILSILIYKLIDIVFNRLERDDSSKRTASKTKTIKYLLKNLSSVIVFVISVLTILSQWGINILPLLTGVGILGLGFSLGAQTLVKDLIAGFFILLENQYNVGDTIKTAGFEGEVVAITLRLTILKDTKGNKIFIPNSQITTVTRLKS